MKVCIVGAGAVGGMLAARLAATGEELSVVDRGAQLAAIQSQGLTLRDPGGGEIVARNLVATDAPETLGPQDLVVLAVKAYTLPELAPALAPLLGEATSVLTLQNGLPWWYFDGLEGRFAGWRIDCLDPQRQLERHIATERILGGVVYTAGAVQRPGVVELVEGDRISLGEPGGEASARVEAVCQLLQAGGFKSYVLPDVRAEIWLKLWGNLSINPLSALSHATMSEVFAFAPARDLVVRLMREMQSVANALGVTLRLPLEKRLAGAERVGGHKTSTLQDVEQGLPLEVDALVGAVVELARKLDVETPCCDVVYAALALLDHSLRARGAGIRCEPSV